ncbi:MAG: hypothetical protein HUK24_00275, partial [Sphaerochaetaceae bacterium]|nr:hypothetical protein [Sphaerochaetaceae bacterium]
MYAALENNGPYSYFLKNFVNLTNNLTIEECEITDTNKYLKEKNNFEKRSNILKFIRQKGLLTLTITIGAITLLSIIWHFIWNAIKPPVTKDLNQVEIIEYVIEGINSLSPDFSEPFSSDKNNPYYTIVTSNYVTGAMRMAYENATAYYTPDQWESSNLEALPLYSRIFGIKDLEIEQIDELTFVLTYKEYGDGGFYYEEGIDPDKDLTALPIGIFVEIRNVEAEIVFKVRRSWYEIESMVITKDDVIQTFSVPYSK